MKSQLFKVFANFTAWIWTILAFIPFVFILLFGVKNTTDIMIKPLAIVFKPALDNFSRAWSGGVGS